MLRSFKILCCLILASVAANQAKAFSLLGPVAEWQISRIGYNLSGDLGGGPMFINEEYRWNIPVITYAFDESFVNYFGSNGIAAVEQAIQILNDLPRASEITTQMISDDGIYPQYVLAENSTAGSLGLADLKSVTLNHLVTQMGLAEPERWVYTIRDRAVIANNTMTNWSVITMNFDPITLQPTNRINDVFYDFVRIIEQQSPAIDFTFNRPVTFAPNVGTVAGTAIYSPGYYFPGTNAYSALTRDDVGGLRYIYHPSNENVETLLPGMREVFTNNFNPLILTNYDLAQLIEETQATTNTAGEVLALFPGINITATNSFLSNIVFTNITSYFTNFPYPLGAPLEQVFVTNYTTNIVQLFNYTVDNLVTNELFSTRLVTDRTYEIVPAPIYTPGGSAIQTNLLSEVTVVTNLPGGSFYIRPTNYIDIIILSNTFTLIDQFTNLIQTAVSANVAVTNLTPPVTTLTTLDYHELYKNSRNTTNTPTDLLALYPDLLITETNSHLGLLITTNIITFFTNYPWAPRQVFVTNYTTNVATFYDYQLANVVGEPLFTERPITILTNEIVLATTHTPGLDEIRTNLIGREDTFEFADEPDEFFGEFFIVPTNLLGYAYLNTIHTAVTNATNIDFFAVANLVARTNTSQLDLLFVPDLATFTEQARTNSPDDLLAIYPDLLILSSNRYFTNVVSSNFVTFFTNAPWDPAFTLSLTQQAIFTTNIATNYNYVFGNVVTNFGSQDPINTNGLIIVDEIVVATLPWATAGSDPTTNVIRSYVITNNPVGNIYIVPTNFFGYDILSTQLVDVVAITNTLVFTNLDAQGVEQTNVTAFIRYETNYWLNVYPIEFLDTNDFGTNYFGLRRETITYHTNTTYEVYPIELLSTNELATNIFGTRRELVTYFTNTLVAFYPVEERDPIYNEGYRPGVDKITFVRVDNLMVTNQLNLTNTYVDVVVTNIGSAPVYQTLRRVVSRPDILFQAGDLGTTVNGMPVMTRTTVVSEWINNAAINGQVSGNTYQAGPGVIPPQVHISYSTVGPFFDYRHQGNQYLEDTLVTFRWGSYDGSTNIIVYPVGTSISDIEQQVLTP